MGGIVMTREIDAPIETVFDIVGDPRQFAKAQPQILKIVFVTDRTSGVGTRFRETRLMGSKRASTELEITEFDPPKRIRLVAEAGGTVWDSLFTLEQASPDAPTRLTLTMAATPKNLVARLANTLLTGMITKAIGADMDAIKRYCEQARARK